MIPVPQKFRKKPIIIEAIQFTEETKDRCFSWITCTKYASFDTETNRPTLTIQTLEGDITVGFGDWIIKGTKGEFYPCKADIFKEVYEPLESYEFLNNPTYEKVSDQCQSTGVQNCYDCEAVECGDNLTLEHRGYSAWKVYIEYEWFIIAATSLEAARQRARSDDVCGGDDYLLEDEATARYRPISLATKIPSDESNTEKITLRQCIDEELELQNPRKAFVVASTLY